ncbi:hypothetical protein K490DRAFT_18533, partial [Saccharata proteae CBS 121410]
MPSLLLVVFALQLAIHLVNTLGKSAINELLWILYNKLPTPSSNAARDSIKLKREVLRLKKEMNGVSAQDEFSRWAKLRRQHDKALAEFNKSDSSLKSSRAKFDTAANTLRWLGTTGARFLLQFWFSKQPLFWIPQGWVPGYVEWILAFPRAPTGSISIQVWGIACASIIALVSEALGAIYVLVT